MKITGTLFGVERSQGTFTPDDRPGERVEYDNMLFSIGTDDYQVFNFKTKTSEMPADAPQLQNGQRYTVELVIPKKQTFSVRAIEPAKAAGPVRAAG